MKGVFCIEGFWYGDHRDKTSVFPILDLAHRYYNVPFIHHKCGTIEEFIFSLKRWKTKSFHKKYPLLYLAFHGEEGKIVIGKDKVTLEQLEEILSDKCEGVIIYFGSCETMNVDKRLLMSFMNKTKTLALLGYKKEVDWLVSSSFEIMLLYHLQQHPYDSMGIRKIFDEIMAGSKKQLRDLDFRMVSNEKWHFPRRRKKCQVKL